VVGSLLRVKLDPWRDALQVENLWCALAAIAHPSYFLSWPWIENWLATLPHDIGLNLVALLDERGPAAAFFVGERTVFHGGFIPSRARFLNETGKPEIDELTIEHNGWLARDGFSCSLDDVIEALEPGWDELVLDAVDSRFAPHDETVRYAPSHFVDLDAVREQKDYLCLLSAETRAQIRRSERMYGKIECEIARDVEQARAIFDELVALHRDSWVRRGKSGAFSSYMLAFHARLIEQRFDSGEIQLVRVKDGAGATIGCLYNFLWNRSVTFYQSGFRYETDNRLKPGLVCHAAAIRHAAQAGYHIYDFLGGDARYKRSLATDSTELAWCTIRKPCLRFALEDVLRRLRFGNDRGV
jgi:hypothetical protein